MDAGGGAAPLVQPEGPWSRMRNGNLALYQLSYSRRDINIQNMAKRHNADQLENVCVSNEWFNLCKRVHIACVYLLISKKRLYDGVFGFLNWVRNIE